MYVDLRIHDKKDNYNRLEIRTNYDLLELQKDVASCDPIKVNDLFLPMREGAQPTRRVLVIGKAGIGKTMLTMHILDKWVNDHLMSTYRHIFYFALRDLSHISQCSLTDLFFELHDQEIPKPSDDAAAEFFNDVAANPGNCLVILDGADEFGEIDLIGDKFEPKQVVDMHKLLSSIIQGKTLGRADLLVTSRPRGIKDTSCFDKTAEIYGLTQDKIFEYISKFCRGDEDLKTSVEDHITGNTNIASLCYIPVQCDLVCRTVRAKKNSPSEQLPETITQLYRVAVINLVTEHHPRFKDTEVEDSVVGQIREPLLSHAKLARDGMGESPVKVTFSKTDIEALHLEKSAIECGLLTFTKEKRGSVVRKYSCVYSFTHLTIQEWLSAVALVSSRENTESMIMKSANDGQLDLVLMFLCGLVGDQTNKEFLDLLGCPIQMTAERVLELVVQRECEKTGRDHKRSVLLILLLLFESRRPELWSSVSDYVMGDDKKLDLSLQHITPVELQAVTFIFHIGDFNSLK